MEEGSVKIYENCYVFLSHTCHSLFHLKNVMFFQNNFRYIRVFLRCFRDPIRVPRIRENYHRVPKIRENRVPRIRGIGSR